jgi:hypothetical protein
MPPSRPADSTMPGPFTIAALRRCAAEHECKDCAYVLSKIRELVNDAADLAIAEGPEENCE